MTSSPTENLVQIEMPQMGVSVAEGTILEWVKQPGDWVDSDETVAMVTTDKVDVEIPSPASGRLDRILVDAEETVPVGTALAEIDPSATPGEAHPEEHGPAEARAAEPEPEPSPHTPAGEAEDGEGGTPAGEAEDVGEGGAPAGEAEDVGANGGQDRSRFYSPVVRRIAEDHGIDLSTVRGTGIGGRVRKRDLLARIEGAPAESASPAQGTEPVEGRPLHTESPYRPETEEVPAHATAANSDASLAERREPMSPMRRRIAEHMLESRRTSAHCTTIVEVDMARVAGRRAELREPMKRRGVPLTYLAFVASATVRALERHPILNASVDGDQIVYHDDVNLGIAVALESGLIVPVIRRAQRLSLEGIAAEIADVAVRAREGGLEPDDVHGGTFTITNPGQFGAVLATPIINQPQVGILDLEAITKRAVVVSENGSDAIAIRPMTYLCMSWDHRALDGAEAARFLGEIKGALEGWEDE